MREHRAIPLLRHLIQPGRVAPEARPGFSRANHSKTGGDGPCYVFVNKATSRENDKEEDKDIYQEKPLNSQHVNQLIRAAALARKRGEIPPLGEDPTTREEIGILVNILRRRKKISLDVMSEKTDLTVDALIAFEAGALSQARTCQIIKKVVSVVGIDEKALLKQIHSR